MAEDDLPVASPRVPLGHRVGVVTPLGQYAFLGHATMVDEFGQKLPAGHGRDALEPGAQYLVEAQAGQKVEPVPLE